MLTLTAWHDSAFGLFQDRDVGVGVSPESEEVLIGRFGFGGVALHGIRTAQFQPRQRSLRIILYNARMINILLKLSACFPAIVHGQVDFPLTKDRVERCSVIRDDTAPFRSGM